MVAWKTEGVKNADTFTDMNDLYIRAWMNEDTPQESDIHWRSKYGKGSFNWRMRFPIKLSPRGFLMTHPNLTIQVRHC